MSPALLAVAALVLLATGWAHLRHPSRTGAQVGAHGVLPPSGARVAAALLGPVEVALGGGLLLAVLLGHAGGQVVLGIGAAVLFAALALYAHTAHRRRPGHPLPCACGVAESPLGPWVTARAVMLALVTTSGVLTTGGPTPGQRPGEELVVLACAAVALAVVLTYLPLARAVPAALPLAGTAR